MPAPEYIEHLMAWVQSNIDNESTFPSRIGERKISLHTLTSLLILSIRGIFPQDLPHSYSPIIQETVPSLRAYLLPPLSGRSASWSGTSSKYQLQALCAFH